MRERKTDNVVTEVILLKEELSLFKKRTFLLITILAISIILHGVTGLLNTNRLNKLEKSINNVVYSEPIGPDPQYTCESIDTSKSEDAITRTKCSNGLTDIETITYANGQVDIIVNGE